MRCLVNPLTGMEDEYDLTPVQEPKRVFVIGGGVSGCEAAIMAAMKGHKVTLAEKSDRLGGQWIPASVPIGKSEFTSFLIWQKHQLEKLGVEVLLNADVDKEFIEAHHPDVVIAATGSHPFIPKIKGWDQDFVVTGHDVLLGTCSPGKRAVVVGGGLVGAETADMLSLQCEKVSIIEMMPEIMRDGEASPARYMKERFKEHDVDIYTSAQVTEIGDGCVKAMQGDHELVIDQVDTVVIAAGVKANTELDDTLADLNCRVVRVGDANGVKNGYLGIREGFEAGLSI